MPFVFALLTPVSFEISSAEVSLPPRSDGSAEDSTLLTCVWVAPALPAILFTLAALSNDLVTSLISIHCLLLTLDSTGSASPPYGFILLSSSENVNRYTPRHRISYDARHCASYMTRQRSFMLPTSTSLSTPTTSRVMLCGRYSAVERAGTPDTFLYPHASAIPSARYI